MTESRSPLPIPLLLALPALIILGYTLRQSWFRSLLFIPISFLSYYIAFCTTTGNIADVGLGSTIIIWVLLAFDGIVLTDVKEVLYRAGEKPGQIISAPFLDRLAWSIHLQCSPRGVGWAHEVPHIPKIPAHIASPDKKKEFIVSRLISLGVSGGLQLLFMVINSANPALSPGAAPLLQQPLYIRALSTFGLGIPGMAHMNCQHCVVSIMCVGMGISEPADWPPLFGSVYGMYSVQSFWRNVWHQMLRRILLSTADFIIHTALCLPRPAKASKYSHLIGLLRLHTVFLVSGMIHFAGEFMMLGYGGRGALYFFIIQAWAITLEVAVRYLVTGTTRASFKPPPLVWRLLGYTWVVIWFIATSPLIQQPMIEADLFASSSGSKLKLKVVRWLAFDAI